MKHTTILSAADLEANLFSPDWTVLDCRHDLVNPEAGIESYRTGHVPNACFAGIDSHLSDKSPGPDGAFRGRHPLPSKEAFISKLRDWGVHAHSQVVVYDAQGGMFAARLWWMLRWVGHEAVAVLDGGLPAWAARGGQMSTEPATRIRGNITAGTPLVATVTAADILANLASGARTVIDARAPDRFRGENETLDPVGGHIPGAVNRFFKDNLQADGRFKPAAELRSAFEPLAQPAQAILQCGSGVTACHNLLAMEIAGLPGAALYPGSWSEWCADPARPVARD